MSVRSSGRPDGGASAMLLGPTLETSSMTSGMPPEMSVSGYVYVALVSSDSVPRRRLVKGALNWIDPSCAASFADFS